MTGGGAISQAVVDGPPMTIAAFDYEHYCRIDVEWRLNVLTRLGDLLRFMALKFEIPLA